MKKTFFILFSLLLTGIAVNAQGGFQRRTVEERVKSVHEKFDSAFKLEATKLAKVDTVFTQYYKATDKIREDMRASGERPDFQTMRDKMQPYADARDKELTVILTEEQYKKWKAEIEPSMMRRPGGGGGN